MTTSKPRIGLVGAGPWAHAFHGPMLAAADDLDFIGVWARRSDAANELAAKFSVSAAESFDALVGTCDALAFCVPPDVQAELASRAAAAGRHLLLEKPLALDLAAARSLASSIEQAGVISQLVLTSRYAERTRRFIADAQALDPVGATTVWLADGALPGRMFSTPWRVERGALPDIGPHTLDLLDACLGPIERITAAGRSTQMVTLTCEHQSGAISTATLSITAPSHAVRRGWDVWGEAASLHFEPEIGGPGDSLPEVWGRITGEFAACIASGDQHPLSAARGLMLQELISSAEDSLTRA